MQFYGARLEQYWSSTAAALQQYWSRFAEILLKQHCNSIGAVLEEFSGGTEQYCSSGAVPQQSWRNIGARLEYACSIGQLAPEYCSNILLDISICIPYSGIPRILLWHFPTVSSTVFEGQLNLEQNCSRRAVIPEQDRLSTGVVPQAY